MPTHIKMVPNSDEIVIEMIDRIDENLSLPNEKFRLSQKIIFDFDRLNFINSMGLHKWSKWMLSFDSRQQFVLRNLRPDVVSKLNRIEGLLPPERTIESFYIVYECENCGHEEEQLLRRGKEYIEAVDGQDPKLLIASAINCDKCKEAMKPDAWLEHNLKFLK